MDLLLSVTVCLLSFCPSIQTPPDLALCLQVANVSECGVLSINHNWINACAIHRAWHSFLKARVCILYVMKIYMIYMRVYTSKCVYTYICIYIPLRYAHLWHSFLLFTKYLISVRNRYSWLLAWRSDPLPCLVPWCVQCEWCRVLAMMQHHRGTFETHDWERHCEVRLFGNSSSNIQKIW